MSLYIFVWFYWPADFKKEPQGQMFKKGRVYLKKVRER